MYVLESVMDKTGSKITDAGNTGVTSSTKSIGGK